MKIPLAEQYQEELQFLLEVGFTNKELNLRALALHDGNRNKALRWLRLQSEDDNTSSTGTSSSESKAPWPKAAEVSHIQSVSPGEPVISPPPPPPPPPPRYHPPVPPPPPMSPGSMTFDGTMSTTCEGYHVAKELEAQIISSLEQQVSASEVCNRTVLAQKLVSYNFTLRFLHDTQLPPDMYFEALNSLCDMDFYDSELQPSI